MLNPGRPETISFPCPHCGGELEVKDSRGAAFQGKNSIRRRRHCKKCKWRVTTFEIIDDGNAFAHLKMAKLVAKVRQAQSALDEMISRYDDNDKKELAETPDVG